MNFSELFDTAGHPGISGAWSVFTDNGIVDGTKEDMELFTVNDSGVENAAPAFTLKAVISGQPEGVIVRDDSITNTSERPLTIRRAYSRFLLPGGEYEAYTQWNGGLKEAQGCWQPLVTTLAAENLGIRSNNSATPMMALYSRQSGRGLAFYIFGSCMWKIEAHNQSRTRFHFNTLEIGVNEKGLCYVLAPGETLALPKIIVVPFTNKLDLDCRKLHAWFNRCFPRRTLPVIYNTWMAYFDRPTMENVLANVKKAAQAGVEYFVQDAGWFGHGTFWSMAVGDWEEKEDSRYNGRLSDLADAVRAAGMKFGLWIEMERARESAPIVHEKPEWFIKNGDIYLLDFAITEAREYALETVCRLVRRYGAEFLKFDFNTDFSYDPSGCGFLKYHQGYASFVKAVRDEFPGIYIEGCASGGYRMEMHAATLFDSFWISDNQSPYGEVRIARDSMKHLPCCCMEKWPVFMESDGFIKYQEEEPVRKLIACHDANWVNVIGVEESWLTACTVGFPLGLSFKLATLSDESFDMVCRLISFYKENRERYRTASARILSDTPVATVIQHSAADGTEFINVFAWDDAQKYIYVYPSLPDVFSMERGADRLTVTSDGGLRINLPAALHAETIIIKKG